MLRVRRVVQLKVVDVPNWRDPDDQAVLAAAIPGQAQVIVTSDGDLRDDEQLKRDRAKHGVERVGIEEFLRQLGEATSEEEGAK